MAADLTDIYGEFRLAVSAVQPTLPLTEADYITLFKRGIRKMYIDTGRSEQYSGQKLNVETMESVSYTHLDVYKRQHSSGGALFKGAQAQGAD